jgi:hypothetical protein
MVDLFHDFWWLLFPLSWIVIAVWRTVLHDRRRAEAISLLRTYKEKGQEPPAALTRMAFGPEY